MKRKSNEALCASAAVTMFMQMSTFSRRRRRLDSKCLIRLSLVALRNVRHCIAKTPPTLFAESNLTRDSSSGQDVGHRRSKHARRLNLPRLKMNRTLRPAEWAERAVRKQFRSLFATRRAGIAFHSAKIEACRWEGRRWARVSCRIGPLIESERCGRPVS